MLTEEEAKTKWCPQSRPVFPRVEDCGYQTGNRNSVADGDSQIMPQSSCIGSACMAWRWIADGYPSDGGFCGLAGRPE